MVWLNSARPNLIDSDLLKCEAREAREAEKDHSGIAGSIPEKIGLVLHSQQCHR